MARGPRSALKLPGRDNTRMRTSPIPVPKSRRQLNFRTLTTIPAGYITPVMAFPLLREDSLTSCRLSFGFELYETVETLATPVVLVAQAWLVPNLAFERFLGSVDTMNRSYMGEAEPGGGAVVPWFTSSSVVIGPQGASNNEVLYHLGHHVATGGQYNAAYHEAYNVIVGYRYINRSPELKSSIPVAANKKLFPALWRHPDLGHIVPDFDQATLDGEVPLNMVTPAWVRGLTLSGPAQTTITSGTYPGGWRRSDGTTASEVPGEDVVTGWYVQGGEEALGATFTHLNVAENPDFPGFPAIFADLSGGASTIRLSDINTAERARSFAALRKAYAGYDDEWLKDLLMMGIRMPTEAEKQPIQLANVVTQFGQGKRYATSADDLTASVSSGAASITMNLRCPPVNSGGIVMVTVEMYPEQLWERRQDPYLNGLDFSARGYDQLPEFVRDTLDPEKVDIVKCGYVDVRHSTPDATFGYEPLHARWQTFPARVGGKFYRPDVDTPIDEDRARIWASETADPKLSKDFYLVTALNLKPFVVTDQDPAEVLGRGTAMITGNTVFGMPLIESGDEYDVVMGQADFDRVEKEDLSATNIDAGEVVPDQ